MSDLSFKEKIGKSFSFLSGLSKKNKQPAQQVPERHIESHALPPYHDAYHGGGPPPPLPPMHPYMSSAHERTNVDEMVDNRFPTPTQDNRFPTPTLDARFPTPDARFPTPTPDIKYPSPFDFARDRPTPVEKMEDLQQLQEALLPSPFDYLRANQGHPMQTHHMPMTMMPDPSQQQSMHHHPHYQMQQQHHHHQQQQPQGMPFRSLNDKQVADEINTLCRDLVTHGRQAKDAMRSQSMVHKHNNSAMKPEPAHQLHDYGNVVESGYTSGGGRSYDSDSSSSVDIKRDTQAATNSNGNKQYRRKNCSVEGCANLSRSKGLCKAHGGGRRCSVPGCTRASQSSSLCIAHGGGKRCTIQGCTKAAQSRGMCKAHGGGVRCRVEGCTKSSQGDGFCRSHGGGRRCGHPSGCIKWAQRNGMCMTHSEGKYGNSYRGRLQRQTGEDTDMIGDGED